MRRGSGYTRRSRNRNRSEAHADSRVVNAHCGPIGESKKSAGVAGARWKGRVLSAGDLIEPIARFGFGGFDFEPVLLGSSGEEAPHTVGLPVGRLLDLGEGGAFGSFDQRQDFRALAVG